MSTATRDKVPGSFAMTPTRVSGIKLPEIWSADSMSDTPTLMAATSIR